MQWETVMEIFMHIGKQLTTHLDFKEALFGIGLIRWVVLEYGNQVDEGSTLLYIVWIFSILYFALGAG